MSWRFVEKAASRMSHDIYLHISFITVQVFYSGERQPEHDKRNVRTDQASSDDSLIMRL